jgi:uncharacterized membrane protein YeaQ/YmgE (transglycosylase-associated protein family)
MSFLWFILIGFLVGLLASILTKSADLGKMGSILICIIGALTSDFFIYSLDLSAKFGTFGNFVLAAVGSIIFLILMRKISKAF